MSSAATSKYVNDMWPGSPQKKASPSASGSGRSSRLSSRSRSRSSSRISGYSRSSSRSSRIHSRPRRSRRSRSRSRSRRRHQRKYRRYSRSYSRSRSRSRGRHHYRDSGYGRPRRSYRSRSRSRSRERSYPRRPYYAIARGRRYYGFGRTVYPEDRPRWRSRTRSRSRSRSPFRLTEKDRMELLEIAKANAAKALGTANFDLPASLRVVARETSQGAAVSSSGAKMEHSEKQTEDGTKNPSEKSAQRNIAFSYNNSIAKPLQKTAKAAAEETPSVSPKIDKKKSPYGLWIPI